MAAITYRASSTYNSGTVSVTSVVNAVPTGTLEGDLMLWSVTANTTTTPATPAGWEIWQTAIGAALTLMTVFSRRASAGDAAGGVSYTATVASARWNGLIVSYGNVHSIIPKETANTTSTSATVPAITTYTANAYVVEIGRELSASGVTSSTWSSSSGTVRAQTTTSSGSATNVTSAICDQVKATPGSVTPNLTCTGTNTRPLRITVALRPSADVDPFPTVEIYDDFSLAADTAVGVRLAGSRTSDSGHPWMELIPTPAGNPSPSGDPGIVSGILKPRTTTGSMYPGLLIPNVPTRVVADFVIDAGGTPGKLGVGLHIWGDPRGNGESVPLHAFIGHDRCIIDTGNEPGNTPLLVNFGDSATTDIYLYPTTITRGVEQRVIYDFLDDTIQITLPPESGAGKVTLTDTRLRSKYLGVSRAMILEGERDLSNEPYNGFTRIHIYVIPGNTTSFLPFFE